MIEVGDFHFEAQVFAAHSHVPVPLKIASHLDLKTVTVVGDGMNENVWDAWSELG
jgi:hypothetical protein